TVTAYCSPTGSTRSFNRSFPNSTFEILFLDCNTTSVLCGTNSLTIPDLIWLDLF
ncbi:hypothetical protein BGW80DRAFT_1416739, partial [Lactifluus volemus]